jgi:hypothetical protein
MNRRAFLAGLCAPLLLALPAARELKLLPTSKSLLFVRRGDTWVVLGEVLKVSASGLITCDRPIPPSPGELVYWGNGTQ